MGQKPSSHCCGFLGQLCGPDSRDSGPTIATIPFRSRWFPQKSETGPCSTIPQDLFKALKHDLLAEEFMPGVKEMTQKDFEEKFFYNDDTGKEEPAVDATTGSLIPFVVLIHTPNDKQGWKIGGLVGSSFVPEGFAVEEGEDPTEHYSVFTFLTKAVRGKKLSEAVVRACILAMKSSDMLPKLGFSDDDEVKETTKKTALTSTGIQRAATFTVECSRENPAVRQLVFHLWNNIDKSSSEKVTKYLDEYAKAREREVVEAGEIPPYHPWFSSTGGEETKSDSVAFAASFDYVYPRLGLLAANSEDTSFSGAIPTTSSPADLSRIYSSSDSLSLSAESRGALLSEQLDETLNTGLRLKCQFLARDISSSIAVGRNQPIGGISSPSRMEEFNGAFETKSEQTSNNTVVVAAQSGGCTIRKRGTEMVVQCLLSLGGPSTPATLKAYVETYQKEIDELLKNPTDGDKIHIDMFTTGSRGGAISRKYPKISTLVSCFHSDFAPDRDRLEEFLYREKQVVKAAAAESKDPGEIVLDFYSGLFDALEATLDQKSACNTSSSAAASRSWKILETNPLKRRSSLPSSSSSTLLTTKAKPIHLQDLGVVERFSASLRILEQLIEASGGPEKAVSSAVLQRPLVPICSDDNLTLLNPSSTFLCRSFQTGEVLIQEEILHFALPSRGTHPSSSSPPPSPGTHPLTMWFINAEENRTVLKFWAALTLFICGHVKHLAPSFEDDAEESLKRLSTFVEEIQNGVSGELLSSPKPAIEKNRNLKNLLECIRVCYEFGRNDERATFGDLFKYFAETGPRDLRAAFETPADGKLPPIPRVFQTSALRNSTSRLCETPAIQKIRSCLNRGFKIENATYAVPSLGTQEYHVITATTDVEFPDFRNREKMKIEDRVQSFFSEALERKRREENNPILPLLKLIPELEGFDCKGYYLFSPKEHPQWLIAPSGQTSSASKTAMLF